DHGCVVDESVDQGGGDHRVAEDLAPVFEAAVRGDDDRAAFVAAGEEGEEQVGRLPFERKAADFVDDQQVVALQALELGLELVAILRDFEAETHSWAVAPTRRASTPRRTRSATPRVAHFSLADPGA